MDETALGPNVVASRPVLFVRAKLRATSRLRSMATSCILNNALSFEQIGDLAIRQVSFGKGRIGIGKGSIGIGFCQIRAIVAGARYQSTTARSDVESGDRFSGGWNGPLRTFGESC
jgi:hypothetical protein